MPQSASVLQEPEYGLEQPEAEAFAAPKPLVTMRSLADAQRLASQKSGLPPPTSGKP